MGREIKRVALDFDWPLHEVWNGYLDPYWRECSTCEGKGETPGREWLGQIVHLLLVAGEDSARPDRSPHPYLAAFPLAPENRPSPDLAVLTTGLAGRSLGMIGHDAIDRLSAVEKIVTAAGLPDNWGVCPACEGSGTDPAVKEASEAWEKNEPPAGEGWQVWETVSEGSPISPVFKTRTALVDWLVSEGYSREAAEQFSKRGWVMSGLMVNGTYYQDIEAAAVMPHKPEPSAT